MGVSCINECSRCYYLGLHASEVTLEITSRSYVKPVRTLQHQCSVLPVSLHSCPLCIYSALQLSRLLRGFSATLTHWKYLSSVDLPWHDTQLRVQSCQQHHKLQTGQLLIPARNKLVMQKCSADNSLVTMHPFHLGTEMK